VWWLVFKKSMYNTKSCLLSLNIVYVLPWVSDI
jgi:hypothetical protein